MKPIHLWETNMKTKKQSRNRNKKHNPNKVSTTNHLIVGAVAALSAGVVQANNMNNAHNNVTPLFQDNLPTIDQSQKIQEDTVSQAMERLCLAEDNLIKKGHLNESERHPDCHYLTTNESGKKVTISVPAQPEVLQAQLHENLAPDETKTSNKQGKKRKQSAAIFNNDVNALTETSAFGQNDNPLNNLGQSDKKLSETSFGGVRDNKTLLRENIINEPQNNSVILSDIRVQNLKGVSPEVLMRGLQIRAGTPYSAELNPSIEAQLMKSGFFKEVRVSLQDTILLIYVVENERVATVNINGAKVINARQIKDGLKANNIGEEGVLNPIMLEEFNKELRNDYLLKGKEAPKINISVAPASEKDLESYKDKPLVLDKLKENGQIMSLKFDIDEGETTRIKTINFKGNTVFTAEQLKRKMSSSELSGVKILSQGSRFNPKQLYTDLDYIVSEYKEVGHASASIPDVKFSDVGTANEPLKQIDVLISEGPKYIFGKPHFALADEVRPLIDNTTLSKLNTIKSGKTFKRSDLLKTQENIEKHFKNQGFAFAKVDIGFTESETDGVKVFNPQFTVVGNNKTKIRNISVSGTQKTKDSTVLKEMRQKSGDEFNQHKLAVSKTKLEQGGLYRNVEMTTIPVSTQNNGVVDAVDVKVDVTERRTGSASVNAGYMQGSGFIFGGAVSDQNAFGTGKAIGLDGSWSKPTKQINATYNDSHLFGQDRNLSVNVYGSDYDPRKLKNNNNDYRLKRYGVAATVGFPVSDFNKIYAGLGVEQMDLNVFGRAPLQYRRFIDSHGHFTPNGNGFFKGAVAKGTLGWGINKTTDPLWGGSGYIANVNAEATIPGSKIRYAKATASYQHFFPLGKSSTVMVGGNVGTGRSFGKVTHDLPFFQTFNAGGISSSPVRAFDYGSLGPKVYDTQGNIVTLGGNNMFSMTAEINSKLPFTKDSSDFRVGAFVDVASVWDNKRYNKLSGDIVRSVYDDPNYKSTFKNELRGAVGVTGTWHSPIGPIKLSYGVPIRKQKGDQVQRFQFSLGRAF